MKIIVGIADMKVSGAQEGALITYSLGSCIGVAIWDPVARVGGLLHYMLPDSELDKNKAQKNPYMFADTGIPCLFKDAYKLGALKNRIVVKIAGASQLMDTSGFFNIGKRNYTALRKIFWKNKVMVAKEDVGGMVNRTISLDLTSGRTILKVSGRGEFEL